MMDVKEREGVAPVCPHCGTELSEVWARRLKAMFGARVIYFCPNCRKC